MLSLEDNVKFSRKNCLLESLLYGYSKTVCFITLIFYSICLSYRMKRRGEKNTKQEEFSGCHNAVGWNTLVNSGKTDFSGSFS